MKKNKNFMLQEIAGKPVLIPFGDFSISFNGVVSLNGTAKFLWEKTEDEIDAPFLEQALIEEYDIDAQTAKSGVETWIAQMKEAGCFEE